MSNGLKRKASSKLFPQRILQDREWRLAENCFSKIFTSMQLICFTVLYSATEDGGFDFTKEKLKNYNKFLRLHNQENIDGILSSRVTESKFRKSGFDCERKASEFPYRAKLKMYGGKLKTKHDYNIMLASVNVAIEAYLILAVHTLRKHYGFSWNDIHNWWSECKKVGRLYSEGMTDEFVMKFIKDECDLDITMED